MVALPTPAASAASRMAAWCRGRPNKVISARLSLGTQRQAGIGTAQVQFHVKGPTGGSAVVNASMYQDEAKQWQYEQLYLDFTSPVPQRVMIVASQY